MEALAKLWGSRIASRRRFLGLTQRQLADRIGRDPMTVSRIERGIAVVPDVVKLRIANQLQDDVGYLFPWPNGERVAS